MPKRGRGVRPPRQTRQIAAPPLNFSGPFPAGQSTVAAPPRRGSRTVEDDPPCPPARERRVRWTDTERVDFSHFKTYAKRHQFFRVKPFFVLCLFVNHNAKRNQQEGKIISSARKASFDSGVRKATSLIYFHRTTWSSRGKVPSARKKTKEGAVRISKQSKFHRDHTALNKTRTETK